MKKCLIITNLEFTITTVSMTIIKPLLHRNHGTYAYTYRTTELHPDGEVQTLVRKQVPPELQESLRLVLVRLRSCHEEGRDDVSLRYLYSGPKPHKRGRPQKYAGPIWFWW